MRLLDLFCCEGGAGTGYQRAGCDVVGVDVEPQSRYPFEFIQADAMDVLADGDFIAQFDVIHASPPCQEYSRALRHMAAPQPQLVDAVRERLEAIGKPYIIENVVGAPLPTQSDLFGTHGVMLCGTSFGLRVYRHRLFETTFPVPALTCNHSLFALNPHNSNSREAMYAEFGRGDPEKVWAAEMGVEWMSRHGARESIPPVFTEYIGGFVPAYEDAA